jgi:stage II sporulation protein D
MRFWAAVRTRGVPSDKTVVMTRFGPSPPHSATVTRGRLVTLLLLTVMTAHCASRSTPTRPAPLGPINDQALTLRVEVGTGRNPEIRQIPLEEYIRGSVPAEMPLGADDVVAGRLARLQAILARTYALANLGRHRREGFDLCSSTHCQVYRPAAEQTPAVSRVVTAAVHDTSGVIITDGRGPIEALFHADCGGHTSSATDVWGGPAPGYLAGVPDAYCPTENRNQWRLALENDHLRRILNTDERTAVGRRLHSVEVAERDAAGRASLLTLDGTERRRVRAVHFRAVLTRQLGARAFRSARFEVARAATTFEFAGQGFGHGVGLCQTGAIVRARRGSPVEQILAHYYPGTWLETYAAKSASPLD